MGTSLAKSIGEPSTNGTRGSLWVSFLRAIVMGYFCGCTHLHLVDTADDGARKVIHGGGAATSLSAGGLSHDRPEAELGEAVSQLGQSVDPLFAALLGIHGLPRNRSIRHKSYTSIGSGGQIPLEA